MVARIKGILLTPAAEWAKIDAEPMTTQGIITGWVVPLAAIPALAGLIGMLTFGIGWLGTRFTPPMTFVITNAVAGYVLAIVGIFLLALVIDALATSFGGTKNPVQAMKVAAFSATAGWVGGIFAIVPMLGIIGLLFALYGLYLMFVGLPMLMRVPQDKAIGYFLVTLVVAIVVYIVVGAVVGAVTWAVAPPILPGAAVTFS